MTSAALTSEWHSFFVSSGLTTSLSAKYAKLFVEHRINKSMLPELNKELLNEVGITAVGDVIAILRKAKQIVALDSERETLAHVREVAKPKPKVITTTTKQVAPKVPITVTKPKASPVQAQPKPVQTAKPVKLKTTSVVPKPEVKSEPTVSPPKRSRLAPDQDVGYSVKMPTGSTEKTRRLLNMAHENKTQVIQQSRGTVFGRLGAAAGPESRVLETVMMRKAARLAKDNRQEDQPEVSSTTSDPDDDSPSCGSLVSDRLGRKPSALARLGAVKTSKSNEPTLIRRTIANTERQSMPDFKVTVKSGSDLRDRLGRASESAAESSSSFGIRARADVSSSSSGSSVFDRLG